MRKDQCKDQSDGIVQVQHEFQIQDSWTRFVDIMKVCVRVMVESG